MNLSNQYKTNIYGIKNGETVLLGSMIEDADGRVLISSTGSAGSSGVQSIVAGANVTVDDTDPKNPIVSATIPPSNIIDGFTLSNVTNAQLDAKVFNDCVFLTGDSSSGHPINASGTVELDGNGSGQVVKGTPSSVTVGSTAPFDGSNGETDVTMANGASTPVAQLNAVSPGFPQIGNATANFTTTQTSPLSVGVSLNNTAQANNTNAIVTANSAGSLVLSGLTMAIAGGNETTISATAAINIDVSAVTQFGIVLGDLFTFTAGSETAFACATAITMTGNSDTWTIGETASADALLAAYASGGGTSGNLIITGAVPTGGITNADYLTCVAQGLTVTIDT